MKVLLRLLVPLAVTFIGTSCVAEQLPTPKGDPAFEWIDRPWEYRYLLQVVGMDYQKYWEKKAIDRNTNKRLEQEVAYYFKPTAVFPVPVEATEIESTFVVRRIDIANDRIVTTPNTTGQKLTARLNRIEHIVLAPFVERPEFLIDFGDFFMGTFAASNSAYSPTICNTIFGDSLRPDEPGRYSVGSEPGLYGYFGCREWAAQLYAKNRPYIDVTSYEIEEDFMQDKIKTGKRKGKYPLIPVTYVRPFIGFSRYTDPPKPVIGNHKGTWACFNDCPDGDAPGPIPDIKAWTAKHNWPLPKKPKNVREFMDKKPDAADLME